MEIFQFPKIERFKYQSFDLSYINVNINFSIMLFINFYRYLQIFQYLDINVKYRYLNTVIEFIYKIFQFLNKNFILFVSYSYFVVSFPMKIIFMITDKLIRFKSVNFEEKSEYNLEFLLYKYQIHPCQKSSFLIKNLN